MDISKQRYSKHVEDRRNLPPSNPLGKGPPRPHSSAAMKDKYRDLFSSKTDREQTGEVAFGRAVKEHRRRYFPMNKP